jgi:phosphate starvation-inducible membrane PsiE
MSEKRGPSTVAAEWLYRAESVVLVLIGIVLIVIAVLLLGNSATSLVTLVNPSGTASSVRDLAIEILDSVLLVMMTMEIVYTVAISFESHQLVAEPFLIIGAIAAIRRKLVITAEGTRIGEDLNAFLPLLLELGLLALIVVAMAGSIYVLRRSQYYVAAKDVEEKAKD